MVVYLKKKTSHFLKMGTSRCIFVGEDFGNQRDRDNNNIICGFGSVMSIFCVPVSLFVKWYARCLVLLLNLVSRLFFLHNTIIFSAYFVKKFQRSTAARITVIYFLRT